MKLRRLPFVAALAAAAALAALSALAATAAFFSETLENRLEVSAKMLAMAMDVLLM